MCGESRVILNLAPPPPTCQFSWFLLLHNSSLNSSLFIHFGNHLYPLPPPSLQLSNKTKTEKRRAWHQKMEKVTQFHFPVKRLTGIETVERLSSSIILDVISLSTVYVCAYKRQETWQIRCGLGSKRLGSLVREDTVMKKQLIFTLRLFLVHHSFFLCVAPLEQTKVILALQTFDQRSGKLDLTTEETERTAVVFDRGKRTRSSSTHKLDRIFFCDHFWMINCASIEWFEILRVARAFGSVWISASSFSLSFSFSF